jgi:hypothetical protein
MKTLLIMELFWYFENMVSFRKNLVYFCSMDDSFINRYDCFQLAGLAKANLQNNYAEKINKDELDSIEAKDATEDKNNTKEEVGNIEDMYSTIYMMSSLKLKNLKY